jgi:serine/threonine protein kinase
MLSNLRDSNTRHIRLPVDDIPEHSSFAYKYFKGHLPDFKSNKLNVSQMMRVLRDTLRGIAELHDRDIMPHNIMLDWREESKSHLDDKNTPSSIIVDQV